MVKACSPFAVLVGQTFAAAVELVEGVLVLALAVGVLLLELVEGVLVLALAAGVLLLVALPHAASEKIMASNTSQPCCFMCVVSLVLHFSVMEFSLSCMRASIHLLAGGYYC